jgi:hypothetical protein
LDVALSISQNLDPGKIIGSFSSNDYNGTTPNSCLQLFAADYNQQVFTTVKRRKNCPSKKTKGQLKTYFLFAKQLF